MADLKEHIDNQRDEKIKEIENRIESVEKEQQNVKEEQAETRIYIKQIFSMLEDIKMNFTNSNDNRTEWIDLVKWIIGGTIFIIVASQFSGGL